jgi:uncharacterized membrane protein
VTVYDVVKFVHILLAIAAVGSNLTYGVWIGRAARDPRQLAFVLRGVKLLDDRIANPAYGLLLLTGLAMLYLRRLAWTTPWILTSLVLYVVVVLVGLRGYTPVLRRQIETLERSGPDTPEYLELAARGMRLGIVLAVVVVVIVFLMVTKPALWG